MTPAELDPNDGDDLNLDESEDLEFGIPVYQGTGLSVRVLTADELDRFLAAHADQPDQRVGAGWDRLQPTETPSSGSPGPDRAGRGRLAAARPGRAPAGHGAATAPPADLHPGTGQRRTVNPLHSLGLYRLLQFLKPVAVGRDDNDRPSAVLQIRETEYSPGTVLAATT